MQVKQGKAYATLTDVKNLIGDVFALVDKYGEVTITSYNKPKYSIVKASASVAAAPVPEHVETKPELQVASVAPTLPEPQPDLEAVHAPLEVKVNPAAQEEPEEPVSKYEADNNAVPIMETIVIPGSSAPSAPAVKAELPVLEKAWDRSRDLEQAWVQKARHLI